MKELIHVLHISATRSWGGGENHLVNLCHELQNANGVKNTILCAEGGLLDTRLRKMQMAHSTAPLAIKIDPRYLLKIGSICRRNRIDLIHIHDSTALSLTVMADKFFSLPPFILSKKTSFPIRDRSQTIYKYNYPKIRAILCVSEKTREITSKNIRDIEKLKVIYHGTRFQKKTESPPMDLRKEFRLSPEVKLIGNIANHTRIKNLEGFIEVADDLVNKKKRNDFFFVQIGSFSKRTAALKRMVREKKLEEHLCFLDFIPEASTLLPQVNISVVTSKNEGIPQFIYESFYHQVPVVSTRVGGIPEIIKNGENGFLADVNAPETIARHILSLSQDRELRDKFTERSRNILLEKFSSGSMAKQTLEEYKKAINEKF